MQPDMIFLMLTFKIAHLNILPLYQEPQYKKERKKKRLSGMYPNNVEITSKHLELSINLKHKNTNLYHAGKFTLYCWFFLAQTFKGACSDSWIRWFEQCLLLKDFVVNTILTKKWIIFISGIWHWKNDQKQRFLNYFANDVLNSKSSYIIMTLCIFLYHADSIHPAPELNIIFQLESVFT